MKSQMDRWAYTNRLRRLPPEHKLIFAFTVLLISLLAHPPVQVCVFLWMSVWILQYAKIPWLTYLRLLLLLMAFLSMSMPALLLSVFPSGPVFSPFLNRPDMGNGFSVGGWFVSIHPSAAKQAIALFVRALSATSCLYFLLLTVPFVEILQVMRRLHMPQILIELLLLMYRFIFLLLETAEQLWIAQISRGGHQGFRRTISDLGRLIVQLFAKTLQQYQQLKTGLTSRGFSGDIVIISPYPFVSSQRYLIEAIIGILALLGLEWMTGAWFL